MIEGKKILLCVTSSVSFGESIKLVRELKRQRAEVKCVIGEVAAELVKPQLFEWASEEKVLTALSPKAEHILYAGYKRNFDLMLIAPATSNSISLIANGIQEKIIPLIAGTAIGSGMPIIMVPTMELSMYKNKILQGNKKKLEKLGVEFVEPLIKEGKAKFPALNEIVSIVERTLGKKQLKGKKILVTAGPTIEEIDDVRIITNKSSGKFGVALAEEAFYRGGQVTLLLNNDFLEPISGIDVKRFKTYDELSKLIVKYGKEKDVVFHAASISDFTVKKIKGKVSSKKSIELHLEPREKLLKKFRSLGRGAAIIGFKAEWGSSLKTPAFNLLKENECDFVVANDVSKKGSQMGSDYNEVLIVDKKGKMIKSGRKSKKLLAKRILDLI